MITLSRMSITYYLEEVEDYYRLNPDTKWFVKCTRISEVVNLVISDISSPEIFLLLGHFLVMIRLGHGSLAPDLGVTLINFDIGKSFTRLGISITNTPTKEKFTGG